MAAVFLVEDDRSLRQLLSEALADEGHEVVVLDDIEQISEHARTRRGVAVVDGWGTSHLELAPAERQSLRALAASVPTILLSGRAWVEHVDADELGVVAVLTKPADLAALLELVTRTGQREPLAD